MDERPRAGAAWPTVPMPSSMLAALAVSGLPSDRFCFEGFPPRRAVERQRWFARLADEQADGYPAELVSITGRVHPADATVTDGGAR